MKDNIYWGIDAGQKNFAYARLNSKGEVLRYGKLVNLITELKDSVSFDKEVKIFIQTVKNLIKDKNVVITMERFMLRGGVRKGMDEKVNMLIGLFVGYTTEHSHVLVTAAQWKNHYNRIEKKTKLVRGNPHIEEHVNDAIFMALYTIARANSWNEKKFAQAVLKINRMKEKEIKSLNDGNVKLAQIKVKK